VGGLAALALGSPFVGDVRELSTTWAGCRGPWPASRRPRKTR